MRRMHGRALKARRRTARSLFTVAALLALALQAFVVQPHIHAFAPLADAAFEQTLDRDSDGAHVSATHEPAGCIVCQALAASGSAALPDAPTLIGYAPASNDAEASALQSAPRSPAPPWQSRAPPTAL